MRRHDGEYEEDEEHQEDEEDEEVEEVGEDEEGEEDEEDEEDMGARRYSMLLKEPLTSSPSSSCQYSRSV